jgi:hypothetical protein
MKSCAAVATLGVFALWFAGTAHAQSSDWPAPLPAQASAQQATTEQAGMTSADATDAQPTNIFVSLRVNSPGDNGPVTQASTTAVAADTANDAATAQDGWQDWAPGAHAAPAPQASAQDSETTQAAATSATATRPKPTNVVLSVRVNSPGDDGPVTQSSTVAVAAQSTNTAATAQKAQQAGAAPTAPVATAAGPPAPGAVADRPADPSAPVSCVNVAPGADTTRIVITLGKSCNRHAAPKRAAAAPKTHEAPVRAAPPPAPAPPAPVPPVVHVAPAVSPAPPASVPAPPRAAPKPRPTPVVQRLRVDPLAAATKVAALVAAAAPVPQAGEARYGVMLALLLAMLGAAAVWSYGVVFRYRFWRWR